MDLSPSGHCDQGNTGADQTDATEDPKECAECLTRGVLCVADQYRTAEGDCETQGTCDPDDQQERLLERSRLGRLAFGCGFVVVAIQRVDRRGLVHQIAFASIGGVLLAASLQKQYTGWSRAMVVFCATRFR